MRTLLLTLVLAGGLPVVAAAQADPASIISAGNAETRAGRHAEAERLYRQALAIVQVQDPDGQNMAIAFNNLGIALENQRKFVDAEAAYRSAHAIRVRVLGADHAGTIATLINLASTQEAQSNFAAAEQNRRVALAARERTLGANHTDTLVAVDRLGWALYRQRKYKEAEPLFRRLVAGRETTVGPAHVDTAYALRALSLTLWMQNRAAEAEPLIRRAVGVVEQSSQPETSLAFFLNTLGAILSDQSKHAEAETAYRTVLAIQERARGPEHTETLEALTRLARHLEFREKYSEAEPLRRRLLDASRTARGPSHSETAAAATDLANVIQEQGKWAEASNLQNEAISIYEKTSGPAHADTIRAIEGLLRMYEREGRNSDAEKIARRLLDALETTIGSAHTDLVAPLMDLARTLLRQEKYVEEERVLRRALAVSEKGSGSAGWVTTSLFALANNLREQDRYEEAEALLRRRAGLIETANGPEHWETLWALDGVAEVLHLQDKFDESGVLHDRILAAKEKQFGQQSENVAEAHVVRALRDFGRRRFEAAVDGYDRALRILERRDGTERSRIDALGARGNALVGLGRFEEGMVSLQQAMTLQKRSPAEEPAFDASLHNAFGTAFMTQARFAEAEAAYRKAHEIYSTSRSSELFASPALLDLGYAIGRQGRLDEALKIFEQARQLRVQADGIWAHSLAPARQAIAWAMLRQSRFRAAEQGALGITEPRDYSIGPTNLRLADAWTLLARARVGLKDLSGAEAAANEALALTRRMPAGDPRGADTLHAIGMIAEAKGDLVAARQRYTEALTIREKAFAPAHPDIAESREALARLTK